MTGPSTAASPRYAVYFAPAAGSGWWRFGAHWLGRDDGNHAGMPQDAAPEGIAPADWQRMTASPRRYGFHATLKAPFTLAEQTSVDALRERMAALAQSLRPVSLGALHPHAFDDFVALVPRVPSPALVDLAARCVTDLDPLRAPLRAADLARRRPEQLSKRERELLMRYGYPHVMERFRFHMTLAMCRGEAAEPVMRAAGAAVDALNREQPLVLDRLCLFEEPAPGADLLRLGDFVLRR